MAMCKCGREQRTGGFTAEVGWLGLRVGGHLEPSRYLSDEMSWVTSHSGYDHHCTIDNTDISVSIIIIIIITVIIAIIIEPVSILHTCSLGGKSDTLGGLLAVSNVRCKNLLGSLGGIFPPPTDA